MIIYSSLYRAFIRDRQKTFSCVLMFVSWTFLKRTVPAETCVYFLCIEWLVYWSQNNVFKSIVVQYLQEDTSPWNWSLRSAQVIYCFHIRCYLQTLLISVFTVFGAFAQSRNALYCFCCVLFCLFQAPLTSCASPWRAGVTRNGAFPKYCHYYVLDTHTHTHTHTVIIPGLYIWIG